METQNIMNVLNDSSNEEFKFATKNAMLQTIKQQTVNTTKITLSNLKQKVSIKSSLTGDITENAGNDTYAASKKLCTSFYM